MTNLEAISIKLQEEKDKQLESILSVSGSAAINRNEYGVNVVDNSNVASSLIFKGLTKSKYDNEELVKAVDVTVTELAPNIPSTNLDLVPRPIYNAELSASAQLRLDVERLNLQITDLNAQVSTLQTQVQTEINNRLSIEQTNDLLVNQIETLNTTIEDFANQIATSLQKSVDESILRASLQSQNEGFKAQIEALIKQIDSLNSIVDGLQSQLGAVQNQSTIVESIKNSALAAGAELINKVGLVSFNPKAEEGQPIIYLAVNNKNGDTQFKNGSSMSITNNDKDPISVEINTTELLYVPKTKYTISASQTEKLDFKLGKVSYSKNDKSTSKTGQLTIKIIRNDGSSESKTFSVKVNIQHTNTYPAW
jgi:chaperonin cofactor prefoldin